MSEKSAKPIRKINAVAISGFTITVVTWLVTEYANIELTPDVAAAITTLVTFGIGYLVPDSRVDNNHAKVRNDHSQETQTPPPDSV